MRAQLSSYHARVRSELERHGGTVEKFIGDAVVAVFGAPLVHEDDAERAVRSALAIRDWALEEDGVDVRLAVNTGEALVSVDARADAGEGLVAGDVINTAARLQTAAPVNGILVGEDVPNRSRSSAMSMAENGVPRMGTPACSSRLASRSGVCPPNITTTPTGRSRSTTSSTSSTVSGSKNSRSEVSASVDTVSGLQLIMSAS